MFSVKQVIEAKNLILYSLKYKGKFVFLSVSHSLRYESSYD